MRLSPALPLALALTWAPLSAAVAPPKLQYQRFTLPNGLTVILHEDRSTPIAHVQLWYHVGSKNERTGRTGFAHLFEHMMFKGSKNVEGEQHTSIVSSVGGRANAYTNEDATVYWNTVPSQYLPLVLWMEADRLGSLNIDEQTFINEREVVKEERRMRVDNQPFGNLNELLYQQRLHHPSLQEPGHRQHGRPRRRHHPGRAAVLRHLLRPEQRHGGDRRRLRRGRDQGPGHALLRPHPAGAGPVPRDIPQEPKAVKEKRRDAGGGVAAAGGDRRPAHHLRRSPDSYPMHVLAKVLTDGNSSRIYKSLVYEKGLAVAAFGGANLIENPNLFFAVAIVNPGQSLDAVEKALVAELDKTVAAGITDRELQRAKNQFARDYILGRETVQQKAGVLAHAEVLHADITTADGEFAIFQNMTARGRPARRQDVFHAGVARGAPRAAEGAGDPSMSRRAFTRRAVVAGRRHRRCWSPRWSVSAGQQRADALRWPSERPPRPLAAKPVKFPPYEIRTLPNGLQVVLVSQDEQPVVSARMLIRAGAAQDPKGKEGLAMLTSALLDQGTHDAARRRRSPRRSTSWAGCSAAAPAPT